MQPENQIPVNMNSTPIMPAPVPKKRWPFSKRTTMLVGAVVGAVVIAGAIFALQGLLLSKKTNGGGQSANGSVYYYNRAGYNKKDLSAGTGDPEALKPVASSTAVTYGGNPVVQSCNVLSLDDLHKANLHLIASPLTESVTRSFFDGKGLATLSANPYTLPSNDATNSCDYSLENGLSVTLNIFQPSYVPASAVQDEISHYYQQKPAVNGSQLYFYQASSKLEYYMLQTGNVYSQLAVAAADGANGNLDQVAQTVLGPIARNLPAELAHPGGPAKMTYASPVFQKSYANACELTDNSDFRKLYGKDASPIATENLSSGVGVINFSDTGAANVNYNYIDNDCERESVLGGASANSSGGISLDQTYILIDTESYLDVNPATLSFAADQKSGQNVVAVNTKIGDQVMFSNQAGISNALTFREGRFIVSLSVVNPGTKPLFSTPTMIESLTPLAQKIAGELKNM